MQIRWNKKALKTLDSAINYGYEMFGEKAAIDFYQQISKYEAYLKWEARNRFCLKENVTTVA